MDDIKEVVMTSPIQSYIWSYNKMIKNSKKKNLIRISFDSDDPTAISLHIKKKL